MKKIYLLCEPKHADLGDQAQLMCTLKWLNENYSEYKVVCLGTMFGAFDYDICLIGYSAYGFPLAAHAKRKGKKAVHLGGICSCYLV